MKKKNIIKLNESQLRKIVAESVKKVLKEGYDYNGWNKRIENKRKNDFSPEQVDKTVKMMASIAKNRKNNPYINAKDSLKEEYGNENELWNRAKQMLDPQVILNALEDYLDEDGLLDEYANRLNQDFDLRTSYQEQL